MGFSRRNSLAQVVEWRTSTIGTAMPIRRNESNLIEKRSTQKSASLLGTIVTRLQKLVLGIVLVAAMFGLQGLTTQMARIGANANGHDGAGAGLTVWSDLLSVCLTESLYDLITRRQPLQIPQSHEELCRMLERENMRDAWYLLNFQFCRSDGQYEFASIVRRPYEQPQHFKEFQAMLATVAGNPTRIDEADFTTTSIEILPRETSRCDPREVAKQFWRPPVRSGQADGY
jgi:hypothetical protein